MQCECAILWLALLYNIFPQLINGTIFEKKLLDAKCVFRFPLKLLSEPSLVLRRIEWDMIKRMCSRYVYALFLFDINETWIFSTVFRKILKYQISFKSVQWEPSCSMRTDGQTDMRNLIVASRNFANAPKNEFLHNK